MITNQFLFYICSIKNNNMFTLNNFNLLFNNPFER